MIYQTIQGQEFEVPDNPPGTVEFLDRVISTAAKGATEDALIELIYGESNPVLGPYPFGGRGAVTKETLENPAYWAMGDLLFRARLARRGVSLAQASARFTLPIAEAAKRLGVTRAAVQKSIKTRRLEAWVKDGQYYVCPDDVDRAATILPETRRGFVAEDAPIVGTPLDAKIGNKPGAFFKLKATPSLESFDEGHHGIGVVRAGWTLLAVSHSKKFTDTGETVRTFFLVGPDENENAIEHEGFYLRGRFKVLAKRTGERAGAAWKEFVPEP